jgi:uncharacterized protein YgiM (DUF1202 family)
MFKTQILYQNDEKWQNVKLGNSSITIGKWGCLLTSITMMLNGIGHNETPETVNEKMKRVGGFDGPLFIPSFLPYVWANCGWRAMQDCKNYPAPIADVDAAIAAGKPVILQVDWSKEVDVQTHFVLVKEKKGDDYVIYDPYKYGGDSPDKEILLTKRYRYNGARLETEISAVLWFDSFGAAAEPPKTTKVPVPAEKYLLYAAEDDLALRAEPSFSGYLWKRMFAGTELICLEPKASAKGKLGVNGRWIQVQDPNGDQGYVAAWYLSETKGKPVAAGGTPAPTASTGTGNLPPGALLFVPTAQLSLRTEPKVAPETLIRYIPITEQLVSLEPAQQAIPKVGVEGQWLKVRDSSGKEGYVAAWYVKYASGSNAGQPAAAPTAMSSNGGPMKVRASAEGVALRTQPIISDATLIKRLPLGTELTVLEPNAEAKIGKNDQWLRVKDPTGAEGIVAAWFVAR